MILLERSYLPHCTIGRLHMAGHRMLHTVEQPWRENRIGESCIPEGDYTLVRDKTGGHQWYRIPDEEVAPRSAIEIHPANRAEELRGCIAPGLELASWWGVAESKAACELLVELVGDGPEHLRITTYRPRTMQRR